MPPQTSEPMSTTYPRSKTKPPEPHSGVASQHNTEASPQPKAGFRLQRLEVLNWGTFNQHIWRLEPSGNNALLTGDIGSGKSTLVDGLTTLLVPSQKITYNKAAGAENKERSLGSYVRGEYKSEKDDDNLSAKAIALRDHRSYSVLLALFYNSGYNQWVALAQVFWLKPGQQAPERIYLVATKELSIKTDFSNFGSDIQDLRKRLRTQANFKLFDSFSRYSAEFRRQMDIASEQAMNLFYQTVSLKSVGNLTDFVRSHMLEPLPVLERIDTICREFENLNQAHKAVLKAKAQIEALQPLIGDCDDYDSKQTHCQRLHDCRELLEAYFAQIKSHLLAQRINTNQAELDKLEQQLARLQEIIAELQLQEAELKLAIDEQGGRRLADIERECSRLGAERQRRKHTAERYQTFCRSLELPARLDESQFHANDIKAQQQQKRLEKQRDNLLENEVDLKIEKQQHQQQWDLLDAELGSLRSRKTNIPARNLAIRKAICDTLDLDEAALPFIGERIQVRQDEVQWQGAIERVLHNFGLSLLVPEQYYAQVAQYVDKTHLRGRLVYFKVPEHIRPAIVGSGRQLLVNKLSIKPDSDSYLWLERELMRRFDYVCCETLEDFRREPKALSKNGQIKSGGDRHEKDDRFDLKDHSRYVLGWSNQEKIAALEAQQFQHANAGLKCIEQLQTMSGQQKSLDQQRDIILRMREIRRFEDIDWQPLAKQIQTLEQERHDIEQGSDVLKQLQQSLLTIKQKIQHQSALGDQRKDKRGSLRERMKVDKRHLQESGEILEATDQAVREPLFQDIHKMRATALAGVTLTVDNCDRNQSVLRKWLQERINGEQAKLNRLGQRIISQMQKYKNDYPAETQDFDGDLLAADEFRAVLLKLSQEDLPRHEERFKRMLNEGTIQNIALFQNQLQKERQDIEYKIEKINQSLQAIDYNPGSYIKLVFDRSQDSEIRQFQQDLRDCLGDTLNVEQDDLYTEHKFLQVKEIIDRFKGREGLVDLDKKWTKKVTDVRNWFLFSASERWREDDKEKEHFTDSAGKSGGQKEKLAYTILASALAYQFGLEWGETRSRSFRFVMIDEAFGRGSDDSARYGLELFRKLNLQLMIVTPLQKIHVIEDYVSTVNFVHNQDGCHSMVRNLTIEEYRQEKKHYIDSQKLENKHRERQKQTELDLPG